jgi:hypothetical protein
MNLICTLKDENDPLKSAMSQIKNRAARKAKENAIRE